MSERDSEADEMPWKDRHGKEMERARILGKEPLSEADRTDRKQIEELWQRHVGGNARMAVTAKEWEFMLALLRASPRSESEGEK